MSGLRFKVGDPAVFAVARTVHGIPHAGSVCEVSMAGDILSACGEWTDYEIKFADGAGLCVMDYQLRKLDPPAEPESLTRQQEEELPA